MKKMEHTEISATLADQKQKRYFAAVMVLHALISRGEPLGYSTARRSYDQAVVMMELESEQDLNAGGNHG
jgi:hypothetical protein